MLFRTILGVLLMVGFWGVQTSRALAHPHEFVQMRVHILVDDQNRAVGMRYDWLFDEFFSAFAVEPADTDGDGKPEPEGLDRVLSEILGNIHGIDYFTKFDQNGSVPKLTKAKPISAKMEERQFRVRFEVAFEKPVSLTKKPMNYSIYDEEFYIAMNHFPDDDAVTVEGSKSCKIDLEAAEPDEETQSFAASLDKTDKAPNDLGLAFAEWVSVSCPKT